MSYPTTALAQVIGPSLLVTAALEAYHADIWADNTPIGVFSNGNILFVAGLSVLRVHNYWTLRPPVLVTLFGWGATLLGLSRMVLPHQPPRVGQARSVLYAPFCVLGAAIAAIGFTSGCKW